MLDNLENEFFLGKRCISGDDGRLTWLVLASGLQDRAPALGEGAVDVPRHVQRRSSSSGCAGAATPTACYLTAIGKGWLWKVPFVTKVTVLQILLTPVTMGLTLAYLLFSRVDGTTLSIEVAIGWVLLTRAIRGFSHLRRHPQEIFLLPILTLTVIFIALPVKLYAFLTMNRQGWLTRHADTVGGDGQSARSLTTEIPSDRGIEALA